MGLFSRTDLMASGVSPGKVEEETVAELAFLHGWASGPEVWVHQEKYFSQERLVKVNYHQGVSNARCDYGPSLYAAAALEIIDRKTHGQPLLLGWSLGAVVALELALLVPEKIKGLILVGGTSCFTQAAGYSAGLPRVLVERMKKRLARNVDQTLEEFYSLMFTAEERQAGFEEQFRQEVFRQGLNWSKEELVAGLDYLLERDWRYGLNRIDVPVLIVHGETDEICPAAAGLYLHENLNNSHFTLLKDCGHVPFLSQAEVFQQTVEEWLYDHD